MRGSVPALLAVLCLCTPALGQLAPLRTYCGIDRPVPLSVRVETEPSVAPSPPSGDPADGDQVSEAPESAIVLLEPQTWRQLASAAVPAGATQVDLAALFPSLWDKPAPGASRGVRYAQLIVGGRKRGPAVVLQPMLSPLYAAKLDRSGAPMFPAERDQARVYSGLIAYVDQNVELETSKGRIVVELRPDVAPNTCRHFRDLVAGGLYTDVIVHRIASLAGRPEADIIQTGDPNGTGQGGCGLSLDLEPSTLPHGFGVVSMARFQDPNSASSQFMIGLNREGTAYLDRKYAAFGVVIAGADVLRAIAASPVGSDNRPSDPPVIRSAKLIDAAPAGEGPGPEADPLRRPGR